MGGSSTPAPIPLNMSELNPFIPSVSGGPFNAEAADENAQMINNLVPWRIPIKGNMTGALQGQFAGSGPTQQFGGTNQGQGGFMGLPGGAPDMSGGLLSNFLRGGGSPASSSGSTSSGGWPSTIASSPGPSLQTGTIPTVGFPQPVQQQGSGNQIPYNVPALVKALSGGT